MARSLHRTALRDPRPVSLPVRHGAGQRVRRGAPGTRGRTDPLSRGSGSTVTLVRCAPRATLDHLVWLARSRARCRRGGNPVHAEQGDPGLAAPARRRHLRPGSAHRPSRPRPCGKGRRQLRHPRGQPLPRNVQFPQRVPRRNHRPRGALHMCGRPAPRDRAPRARPPLGRCVSGERAGRDGAKGPGRLLAHEGAACVRDRPGLARTKRRVAARRARNLLTYLSICSPRVVALPRLR
jgi:hypothetical protein